MLRHRDQRGQIFWRQDELDRFERHNTKRVKFLGHLHSSNLGRERRARPSTDSDRREQWAEFTGEADRNQVDDVMQCTETSQFRGSLHGENESGANGHEGHHGQRVHTNLEHLSRRRPPAVTVSYKRQRTPHGAQGRPQLNVQASDVVEMLDRFRSDVFENCCHQDTFNSGKHPYNHSCRTDSAGP